MARSRCCVAPWQHSAGHDYGHLHGRSAYGKAVRTDADIIALISALTELRGAQSNPCNLPPTAYLQSASGDKALFGRSTVNFRSLNAGTSGSTALTHHTAQGAGGRRGTAATRIGGAAGAHAGNCRGGKHRRLELHGDLFQMVALTEAAVAGSVKVQNARKAQFHGTGPLSGTPLVAGAGFEPATFRL